MATDNRSNQGKGGNNGKGNKEPLVLLHGDDQNGGDCVSAVHVFLRPLIWGLVWYLNHRLLQTLKERGPARYKAENRLINTVLQIVAVTKSDELLDRASVGWRELLDSENPGQVKALDEVAEAIKRPTFLICKQTGRAETFEDAAIRLIADAVFCPNKFIANNHQNFADALVEAKILTADKAKEVIEAAIAQRDGIKKEDQAA